MKNKFTFELYLIYIIIQLSKSLTPIWNFTNSVTNLFLNNSEYSYTICNKKWHETTLTLTKTIQKGTTIVEQNYVKINNEEELNVDWENIESFYYFDKIGYICPSGKNNLTIYKDKKLKSVNNHLLSGNINDWDLKCYYQERGHYIFLFYLNTYNKGLLYFYKIKSDEIKKVNDNDFHGFFDFIWVSKYIGNYQYNMVWIVHNETYINLQQNLVTIDFNYNIYTNLQGLIPLNDELKYIKANFTNDNYLYYITYDESNYYSGYSKEKINVDSDLTKISFNKNNNFPLEFVNNFTIKSIDFIRQTKYVYYTIELNQTTNQKSVIYYGIIDIINNKVLFNTNEEIKSIKPFSSNSLLIITNSSAYKLCTFTKGEDNNCINECTTGELILDTEKSNYCGNKTEKYCENFILKPNNICVLYCNDSIYKIEKNSCYLCKDMNESKTPYKIFNESNCIENKPENTYFLYEKLKILKYCHDSCKSCSGDKENECLTCNEGYKLENGKCIKNNCYETCIDCKNISTDEKEQNCTSCKNNKLFQEDKGNCIDKCLNGYYEKDKYCKNCYEDCETCNKGGNETINNCTTCKDNTKLLQEDNGNCIDKCLKNGYYEESNHCKNCYKDCETCNKGGNETIHNCNTCKDKTKLFQEDKGNCIDKCLDGYYEKDKYCKNCNSNCKTCNNSINCTSCNDKMFLINDTQKCLNECDISYYKNDSERKCYKCNTNCKSCSRGSENDNNYCLSCNENSTFKYLVNSTKYGLNCVEKCPNNTKLNENLNICFDEVQVNVTFWKFVFVFLILFSIFVVFYVIYMCKPKNFDNINILSSMNNENDELFGIDSENKDNTN